MRATVLAILIALAGCGSAPQQIPAANPTAQMPSKEETERYMRRSAEQWAAGDAAAMREFLADDYQGVASTGELRTKAKQLELAAQPSPFSATKVDYVNFRHFGDTVIAQGAETLTPKGGGADRRLIWTDIWMFRDGQWKVVASQDSVRPPEGRTN